MGDCIGGALGGNNVDPRHPLQIDLGGRGVEGAQEKIIAARTERGRSDEVVLTEDHMDILATWIVYGHGAPSCGTGRMRMTDTRRRAPGEVPRSTTAASSIVITVSHPSRVPQAMARGREAVAEVGEIVLVPLTGAAPESDWLDEARGAERAVAAPVRLIRGADLDLPTARTVGINAARGTDVVLCGDEKDVLTAPPARLPGGVEGVPIPMRVARAMRFTAQEGVEDPAAWTAAAVREEGLARIVLDQVLAAVGEDSSNAPPMGADDALPGVWHHLAALDAQAVAGPLAGRVRRRLMAVQAARLNQWLRRHPDRHAQVVEKAAALGLRDLDWSLVNTGLARHLAVCYLFPPALDTSGLVAAKRLRERHLVTDVISHDLRSLRSIDHDSLRIPGSSLGRRHVVAGKARFAGWGHIADFAAKAWKVMSDWESEQGPYLSVYSRAMPPAAHYAAALIKLRRPEIHWVAEFSDPLDLNPLGQRRAGEVKDDWLRAELTAGLHSRGIRVEPELRLFEWCERLAYALADEITFTNDHQRRVMLEYCGDSELAERAWAISTVAAHPQLPAEFYSYAEVDLPREPGTILLAYFGVFYATRDLGDVAAALGRLSQDERDRIRLHVYTPDPDALTIQLAERGLGGTVRAHAYRPFYEFLALTRQFDVLIVDDARTREHHALNPYLPSKLADYRGSGTAIWALPEPGSILSTLEHDFVSTLGDIEGAVGVLRSIVARFGGSPQ